MRTRLHFSRPSSSFVLSSDSYQWSREINHRAKVPDPLTAVIYHEDLFEILSEILRESFPAFFELASHQNRLTKNSGFGTDQLGESSRNYFALIPPISLPLNRRLQVTCEMSFQHYQIVTFVSPETLSLRIKSTRARRTRNQVQIASKAFVRFFGKITHPIDHRIEAND